MTLYSDIKEVDTTNGVLYLRGNNVIHDFWYFRKGGDKGETILKSFTFDFFTLRINIY